ncbi:MAG: ABC transporter ATP-binding protein [Syntrophomonadaceae bacterium]|nr:ABC transporter ATP-binding protein [Syntrophomonadaceae bacterium]
MAASVDIKQICKAYGRLQVIDGWNLSINPGERVAVLGPSGAGKTTFLRMVAGLEQADTGRIQMSTNRTAFVFQEPRLIPWRNVKDNLRFVNPSADISAILQQLRLEGFQDYMPSQLSGGMQQRVNLARALIIDPELLILDEAFTSLDLPFKLTLIRDLLDYWHQKHFTMLMVTHDLKEALYLADRILVLSNAPARILHDFPVRLDEHRSFSDPELLRHESQLLDLMYDQMNKIPPRS